MTRDGLTIIVLDLFRLDLGYLDGKDFEKGVGVSDARASVRDSSVSGLLDLWASYCFGTSIAFFTF